MQAAHLVPLRDAADTVAVEQLGIVGQRLLDPLDPAGGLDLGDQLIKFPRAEPVQGGKGL